MARKKKKSSSPWFDDLFGFEPRQATTEKKSEEIQLRPALRQIGISDCPVCKHEVAVFLTKTHRPFINCGFCSVRIFYNGRESMRRLKRKMTEVGE